MKKLTSYISKTGCFLIATSYFDRRFHVKHYFMVEISGIQR